MHVLNSLGVFSIYCQLYCDGSISVAQITGMLSVHCESNWPSTLCAETVSKVLFANNGFYFIFITLCLCSTSNNKGLEFVKNFANNSFQLL